MRFPAQFVDVKETLFLYIGFLRHHIRRI